MEAFYNDKWLFALWLCMTLMSFINSILLQVLRFAAMKLKTMLLDFPYMRISNIWLSSWPYGHEYMT